MTTGVRHALVLSGGGARGAYEAGVVAGVIEALGLGPEDAAPIANFVGTSVGAINATYLASRAHRGDLAVDGLCAVWRGLELPRHLAVDPRGLLGMLRPEWKASLDRLLPREEHDPHFGPSLLDPHELEDTIVSAIDWSRLRRNVDEALVGALIVTALRISDGRTTMFADMAAGRTFRPSRDPGRHGVEQPIGSDHVLASAAIPLIFPARRIGAHYYVDGGLRFNTPIAPAIRTGADRLLVVSLRHRPTPSEEAVDHTPEYPTPLFLVGKLLDALLLDPIQYDLQILGRFNRLVEVLEETLTDEELVRVRRVMEEARGQPYRRLQTLVFSPSENIGDIAGEHLEENLPHWQLSSGTRWFLELVSRSSDSAEADLASFLLFDGGYAERLCELGRRDVRERADEVRAFFAPD